MTIRDDLNKWLENAVDDPDIIDELNDIKDNDDELYERFYQNLTFGTAGLRGIIGAGSNRMNIYTVRKATQGLADFLIKNYSSPSVAISYDSRIKARLFSTEAARVLAGNGIKVYITNELQPTPVLSFLVRRLSCSAGIMITASHNPAKYNGYKCYGSDGCQMTDNNANAVYSEIEKLDMFKDIKLCDFDKACEIGLIDTVSDDIYDDYLRNVLNQRVNKDICNEVPLRVVYTPLNGAGNKLIRKALTLSGVKEIEVVKEQENPDGSFPTCPFPNPEYREALNLGIELCKKVNPDLLLASDPDSDRVGVAVKNGNDYRLITGNEIGIMLSEYLLQSRSENGTLPKKPIIVKTIVSSVLVNKIAKEYGCEIIDVLTGFKYIGEQILELEKKGEEDRFVLGFEESYGYLAGTYVRDKDAVVAATLICELAAFYKKQGKNLGEVIDSIYKKYGYYRNETLNISLEGASGVEKIQKIMRSLRNSPLSEIAGYRVIKTSDYLINESYDAITKETTAIKLPKSNVLSYSLEGDNAIIVRPSGTEPKIKMYITASGNTKEQADEVVKELSDAVNEIINAC